MTRIREEEVNLCLASYLKSESWFVPTPPVFDAPIMDVPPKSCHDIWYGKTRMVGYPTM